jgi:hypothetical protein
MTSRYQILDTHTIMHFARNGLIIAPHICGHESVFQTHNVKIERMKHSAYVHTNI